MKSYCDCLGRHPVLKKRSFSPNQNPWVLGQGMVAKLQYKEDKLNHQLPKPKQNPNNFPLHPQPTKI